MVDVGTLQEMCAYNRWANARVFDAVSSLSADRFVEKLGGSFPSLRDTLTHIVWAERVWLCRWTGSPAPAALEGDFPRPDALRARWQEIAAEQRGFVDSLRADRLGSMVKYVNFAGQAWEYPLWRQMVHVVNHSSYHRGQVATMLRQLGERPAATDFLVFHDELDAGRSR
jgi:uncharacterized damage-inducible protein DinB